MLSSLSSLNFRYLPFLSRSLVAVGCPLRSRRVHRARPAHTRTHFFASPSALLMPVLQRESIDAFPSLPLLLLVVLLLSPPFFLAARPLYPLPLVGGVCTGTFWQTIKCRGAHHFALDYTVMTLPLITVCLQSTRALFVTACHGPLQCPLSSASVGQQVRENRLGLFDGTAKLFKGNKAVLVLVNLVEEKRDLVLHRGGRRGLAARLLGRWWGRLRVSRAKKGRWAAAERAHP